MAKPLRISRISRSPKKVILPNSFAKPLDDQEKLDLVELISKIENGDPNLGKFYSSLVDN